MRLCLLPLATMLLLLALGACSHGAPYADLPCAPAREAESWPADPTALTPAAWPEGRAFSPVPHAPFPSVVSHGGGELATLRLVSVVTAGDPLRDALYAFGDALVGSDWLAAVGRDYGVAPRGTSIHLDGPTLDVDVSVHDMAAYVRDAIHAAPAPASPDVDPRPDGATLYLLYLPVGVEVALSGQRNCGCNLQGGAHTTFDAQGDALAYVQRCSLTDDSSVTRTASHEVAEAMTDTGPEGFYVDQPSPPWSASAWAYLQSGRSEVGDLCSGTFVTEGEWTYQRIWSASAAAAGGDPCVPALASPWFDTSSDVSWADVAPGQSVTIPMTGWSTGARADWYVYALVASLPPGVFTAAVTTANEQQVDGVAYASINDGDAATLTVTASASAHSGAIGMVHVVSRSADHVDGTHTWPVGVRVP
jgi:hypothetical protein